MLVVSTLWFDLSYTYTLVHHYSFSSCNKTSLKKEITSPANQHTKYKLFSTSSNPRKVSSTQSQQCNFTTSVPEPPQVQLLSHVSSEKSGPAEFLRREEGVMHFNNASRPEKIKSDPVRADSADALRVEWMEKRWIEREREKGEER